MTDIKVYFARSISGEHVKGVDPKAIIGCMRELGATVLTEHFALENPNKRLAEILKINYDDLTPEDIEKQDTAWIGECTHFVGEISGASTGVGREIEFARNKHLFGHAPVKILCLYEDGVRASWMITGMTPERYPNVTVRSYKNSDEIKTILKEFLTY